MFKKHTLIMLPFILMAMTGTFGAEDGGGLQLYLRIYGHDDLQSIEVPAEATVQNVMDKARIIGHSKLTVAGRELQRDQTLADAGVSSECIVEVTTVSDIELLFQLFDDPSNTEILFGYSTYSEFEAAFPVIGDQKIYIQHLSQVVLFRQFGEIRIIFQGDSVESITIKGGHGAVSIRILSLNWNTLQQFRKLRRFEFTSNKAAGHVPFAKLPRSLKKLCLFNNMLSGTVNFAALPPGLKTLNLAENYLTGPVDFAALPPSMTYVDLRANDLLIEVGEIKKLDRLAERQKIVLYVRDNHLSGVMKRSELPFKLQRQGHDSPSSHYRAGQ